MHLDIDFVRQQFPAFSQPTLKDQAFFENAGGSYACQQVIDRLHRFYTQRKVQPYSVTKRRGLGVRKWMRRNFACRYTWS